MAPASSVPALVDQRQHLLAGLPVVLVDRPDVLVERGVGRLGLLQLVEALREGRLGLLDLPVVLGGILGDEQCHRPVVALRRHRIEHLLCPASLHLRIVELGHAIVHLPDDEETEQRHRHEQQGTGEEAEEQLAVDASFHTSDRIDDRAQPAREARHLRFGGRHHLVTSHLRAPISECGDRDHSARPIAWAGQSLTSNRRDRQPRDVLSLRVRHIATWRRRLLLPRNHGVGMDGASNASSEPLRPSLA